MKRLAAVLVLVCILQAPAIDAQTTADRDSIPSGIPQLVGHRFVPSGLVPSPFVRTYLRNAIGVGATGNLETPPITVGGTEITSLKGTMLLAALEFEYQLALKRWLALRAQFGLAAQTGTEVNTLLAEGVGTSLDFQVGWLVGLAGGEKTQLSLALDISNRSVTGMSVLNLVENIVEGTDLSFTRKTPVLNGLMGLRGAWAVSNLVGFNAAAEYGSGETSDRSRGADWFYRLGGAVTFDLDQYGLPLGAGLFGTTSNFGGDTVARRDNSSEAGFKLTYIGRDAFLLSFFVNWARVPTDGLVEDLTVTWTGFSLQYYF
jgi:hypothetical protein